MMQSELRAVRRWAAAEERREGAMEKKRQRLLSHASKVREVQAAAAEGAERQTKLTQRSMYEKLQSASVNRQQLRSPKKSKAGKQQQQQQQQQWLQVAVVVGGQKPVPAGMQQWVERVSKPWVGHCT